MGELTSLDKSISELIIEDEQQDLLYSPREQLESEHSDLVSILQHFFDEFISNWT
jgi:hypothetical protein